MSETRTMLAETADRLFADLAEQGDFAQRWAPFAEAAFPSVLIPEEAGGFGGEWADAFPVLRLAGFHALALPVGESIVAAHLLHRAGLPVPDGVLSFAAASNGKVESGRFTGTLAGVPFGRQATSVVASLDGRLLLLDRAQAMVTASENAAGEPRDGLFFEGVTVENAPIDADLTALGALIRTGQIAGSLDAALALSITYANERVQFGKPIGKLQAVQQNLAIFAEETAAVNCAAEAAFRALDSGDASFEIAAAKLRANMAIGVATTIAHQTHGAIGFTQEYRLHHFTRRLVAWRSEFGNDRHWATRLGRRVAAAGGDRFWADLTQRTDTN